MFSRKKKFFVLSIALLCVSCLIFSGCSKNNSTQQTPPASNNQTDDTQTDGNDTNGDSLDGNNQANSKDGNDSPDGSNANDGMDSTSDSDLNQRAEKIADAVTKEVEQVKDTRTVISEKMAYVSVSIDETANSEESAALKDQINDVVKKTDAEIETVYVMEDADTFTRMKEIGQDIANGKPISGFAEELQNLFVRVTPTKES